MRAPVSVTGALLLIGAVASPQVGHSQGKLLQDTARFRGTTWEVIPLVRLDSSKTNDTLAVRELGRVFWLGPRRFVYEAKLARQGKWALFGVVDESVRRLAVSGEWFAGPGGARTRILWGNDYRSEPLHAGPGALVTGGTIGGGLPNSLFTTDGVSWRRIATFDSTIILGGIVAVSFGCSHDVVKFEADGAILLRCFAKHPQIAGVFRLRNGTLEAVLKSTDSVAHLGPVEIPRYHWSDWDLPGRGIKRGLREFVPTKGGWIAVVRAEPGDKKYQDHVLRRTDNGPVAELWRTEAFSNRERGGIGFAAAAPAGAVILEYGEVIGVVEADGAWHPLLTASEIKPPKDGGYALLDVTWLDPRSNRALLSVWPYRWQGYRLYALWPKQYYYDGTGVTEVRPDPGPGLVGAFSNLAPQPVARTVPGYDEGVIVHHPLLFKTSIATYFDPDRAGFVPAPAFRTQHGDLGLERLVGWNGPKEAVVRWNGLAILRQP